MTMTISVGVGGRFVYIFVFGEDIMSYRFGGFDGAVGTGGATGGYGAVVVVDVGFFHAFGADVK